MRVRERVEEGGLGSERQREEKGRRKGTEGVVTSYIAYREGQSWDRRNGDCDRRRRI